MLLVAAGSIGLPAWLMAAVIGARPARPAALLLGAGGSAAAFGAGVLLPGIPEGLRPAVFAVQDLARTLAAAGFGSLLAGLLREPNILLPAGLFAAFADFVVVRFGTVKHVLSTPGGRQLVAAVSARVPAIHPGLPQFGILIGPADFLFLAFFLACAARFELGLTRNAVALSVVLAATLLAVPLLGSVPALVPMALAFLALNARRFHLTRSEVLASVLVVGLSGALFAGYFLLLQARRGAG
jgi:hypothetical protein